MLHSKQELKIGFLRDRRGDGEVVVLVRPVMDRHLSAFAVISFVTKALIRELFQGEAAPEKHSRLSVLRQNDVFWTESGGGSDVDGFFSDGSEIEGDSSLTLSFVEDVVHHLKRRHLFVHSNREFLAHLN